MNEDKKLNVHLYYFSDENKDKERKRFYEALRLDEPVLEQRISHNEMEAMIPYLKQQIVSSHRKKAAGSTVAISIRQTSDDLHFTGCKYSSIHVCGISG